MKIRRASLEYEGHFVQVPNAWVRDTRLSRRARGLLVELLSHKEGFTQNFAALQKAGPEGREALQSTIRELKKFGYLAIVQGRDEETNLFGEVEYVVVEPEDSPVYGFPVERASRSTGEPYYGKSETKNTKDQEHYSEEHQEELTLFAPNEIVPPHVKEAAEFDRFWSVYPRPLGKKNARARFAAALKEAPAEVLVTAALAYREWVAASGTDLKYVPYPEKWLREQRWMNRLEPVGAPAGRGSAVAGGRAVAELLRAESEQWAVSS